MRHDALKTIERTSLRTDSHRQDGSRSIRSRVEAVERHDGSRQEATWREMIERYVEGWAEANPIKILHAAASGYSFDDPFIGVFSRWSLPRYFERLQEMLAVTGPLMTCDLAFCLHGPTDQASDWQKLQFWREAPRVGLTGVTWITFGEHGVIGETVTYDLNLASHLLRHAI